MIKVLLIGQLPKEVGGTYTTGIAKVVYELSKQKLDDVVYYMYATNCKYSVAQKLSEFPNQYSGYRYLLGRIAKNILTHPIRTLKEWKAYRKSGDNPFRFELYKANFQAILNDVKPDIIHMNGNGLAPLAFADVNPHVPIVLTCHGIFERYEDPQSLAKLYADYLTGLTDETWDEIHRYYCFTDNSKIRIIPNGVDTSKFYFSQTDRENLRRELGVGDSTKVFVTVASVQERKGQFLFVKIIEKLSNDYQYWIIGQGSDTDRIQQYCLERGLNGKVKLLGYINSDELYKYYSAADIYAHASTMEGQALCEIEAFSTGIKVLVNDKIKGTIAKSELAEGDYLMLDFEHPEYEKLTLWINNCHERKSIKSMDWGEVAKQYADWYKHILKEKNN
jgi:glycosyltransferase involved in cell wall biosynthesis